MAARHDGPGLFIIKSRLVDTFCGILLLLTRNRARLSGKGDKMRMTDTEKLIRIIIEHPELTGQIRMILSQITQQIAVER